jgi:branched-chain amino acid aminotransferase
LKWTPMKQSIPEKPNCATWQLSNGSNQAQPFSILPAPASSDEAAQAIPGGAYTTFRTFHHEYAFHMDDHFSRLEESARLYGFPLEIDRERLRAAICRAIREFPVEESRIRVFLDLTAHIGDLYLSLELLKTPTDEQYAHGIKTVTINMARENPSAKLTRFIDEAAKARREIPADAVEGIMVDPGEQLLEGLSSNFFGVLRGGIYTAGEGVLAGITRALVIDEATKAGIPVHLEGVKRSQVEELSEAFITSSGRAVLPVTRIDQFQIGTGQPGALTRDLLARYLARIDREIEPI